MISKKFVNNAHGSVAMIIAVVLPVILLILALTIDMGKMQMESVNNQSAVDAAAYSTAAYIEAGRIEQLKLDREHWNEWVPTGNSDSVSTGGGNSTDEIITEYAYKIMQSNAMADQNAAFIDRRRFNATYDSNADTVTVESCMTVNPDKFASTVNLGENHAVCSKAVAKLTCRPSKHIRQHRCDDGSFVDEEVTVTNPGCKQNVRTPACPDTKQLTCGTYRLGGPASPLITAYEGDKCSTAWFSNPIGGPDRCMGSICTCNHGTSNMPIHGGGSGGNGMGIVMLEPGKCGCDNLGQAQCE